MAFDSLSEKLQNVFKNLRSKGRLTEDDVKAALKEVKMALLEADVNFKVVKGFVKPYYTDGILASLFGGIMMGAGLSLVFLRGATTGGTDIAAKLINHKFRFVSIGRIIMFMDLAVVAISALVYKNFQSALYSIVSIYAASRVMDGLLYGTDKGKFMHIITSYPNEISKAVFAELGRGVTLVNAVGGYTGEARSLLLCAVRPSEVTRLQSIVRKTDASAFKVISDAGEILGEGFKKNE